MKNVLRQFLFYSVSCMLLLLVISKCMLPVLAILKTEPENHYQKEKKHANTTWSEKDIRKFEELAEENKEFSYQGIYLKTLDARTEAIVRQNSSIKITLTSIRVMKVKNQKTYLSMLDLTVKNESTQSLMIDRTLWKYVDHNQKSIPMDHQLNLLSGAYLSQEMKRGMILLPSNSSHIPNGTLIIPYTISGKVEKVIIQLDEEKKHQ